MTTSNYLGSALHELILNGVAFAEIADNAATSPATEYYLALHSADPGAAGTQDTSEATYPGYARISIARDGTRWTVTDRVAALVGDSQFPEATSTVSETLTHFSIGRDATGAGEILYSDEVKGNDGNPQPFEVVSGTRPLLKETVSTITLS
ncbi:MAG: hypothetical protein FKY71_08650 [Spiribacter salinus]|uniref:Uncharacterized protein n=1 Tax=Spiribacter salinus TaxID=1335746 RepID=A0A540VRP4_9GAMM|nr:MAG: hypothetical protein FKY71_08650 [Spiribacter salinus]